MHTPGPWKVFWIDAEDGEDWPNHILIGEEDSEEVATIVHRDGPGNVPEEKWANARLIASAPALLEALEVVASAWDDELAVIARKAIREAKGD